MPGVVIPVMAYYPEPTLDYSLVGSDFSLVETFLEGGSPAPESVLRAASQSLQGLFPTGMVNYDTTTGKVSLSVENVDRSRAEAFLDALRTDVKFAQMAEIQGK